MEQANFVRLVLDAGEIDVVAASNLTEHPYEVWEIMGRPVNVETAAEIVAKKLYHRGYAGTARDLFDLAVVIEAEPEALRTASRFLVKHADAFIRTVKARPQLMNEQFVRIMRLNYRRSYDECVELTESFLADLR